MTPDQIKAAYERARQRHIKEWGELPVAPKEPEPDADAFLADLKDPE